MKIPLLKIPYIRCLSVKNYSENNTHDVESSKDVTLLKVEQQQ